MIDLEDLRLRLGTAPPALFQWVVGVPPSWLARARAAVPRPCPRGWPKRLAEARWLSCDEAQDLFDALGVWPAKDLVSYLACGLPVTVGAMPRRSSDPVVAVDAFPAPTVGFALLLMSRLGLPLPVDELLRPLKRRLAREALLKDHERHVHQWTSTRERRVSVFLWLGAEETSDHQDGGWNCCRLYDGRAAFSFRSRSGFVTQVIARQDVHRDLGLALLLAGAPIGLTSSLDLHEVARTAPLAGNSAKAEPPMVTFRQLMAEVQHANPDQPRRNSD